MDIIQILARLGFTEYEAKAYVTLLQHEPLNGYELARESKLPRANVYSVLEKLENRGAVTRLETPTGTRYSPIPSKELTQQLGDQMQSYLLEAEGLLGSLQQPPKYDYIWNTHGYPALIEHAHFMIHKAQRSLLIALSSQESLVLKNSMESASTQGVEITTLCLQACQENCGRCRGHVFRYHIAPEESSRWLIVIVDGEELLAGEISAGAEAQSVRTRQRLLVDLTAGYIRRSITLAVLLDDLEGRPLDILTPQARSAMQAIDPAYAGGDWQEHFHHLFQGYLRQSGSSGRLPIET